MSNKLYIASPLGFSEAGRHFMYEKFIPIIHDEGYVIHDPWYMSNDNEEAMVEIHDMVEGPEKTKRFKEISIKFGRLNEEGIRGSDGMVAVLDGNDVDSGTAAEIGFACAQGIPILGYRGDFRQSGENSGVIVNMQVQYFIEANGGEIITSLGELPKALVEVFG